MSEKTETVRELSETELKEVNGGMWYMYVVQAATIMGSLGGNYYRQGVKDLS